MLNTSHRVFHTFLSEKREDTRMVELANFSKRHQVSAFARTSSSDYQLTRWKTKGVLTWETQYSGQSMASVGASTFGSGPTSTRSGWRCWRMAMANILVAIITLLRRFARPVQQSSGLTTWDTEHQTENVRGLRTL